jgi:prepilin-type processing-associated H-X9-DG protein
VQITYTQSYITGGNDGFAPPLTEGNKKTNIFGAKLYPTSDNAGFTGWPSDYAPCAQVKTLKDSSNAEYAFANPLVAAALPWAGDGSKGAMRQNGKTPIMSITDGTSNTTLYSEAAGRDMERFARGVTMPLSIGNDTGMIWADADNRITITGTDATGLGSIGSGSCVINCNNLTSGDIFSFHTSGANVLFADGSVRFMRSSIDVVTFASLVTKGGGEVVNASNY